MYVCVFASVWPMLLWLSNRHKHNKIYTHLFLTYIIKKNSQVNAEKYNSNSAALQEIQKKNEQLSKNQKQKNQQQQINLISKNKSITSNNNTAQQKVRCVVKPN